MRPVQAGAARPLGATLTRRGVNFALYSSGASAVEICLYDRTSGAEVARHGLPARTGDVWHGLIAAKGAGAGTRYAYRVHGPWDPERGQRFDPAVPLLDPYARALAAGEPLRCEVVDPAFDWAGDRPPAIPWQDTVIGEVHVKGFTKLHPAVPERWRGTYLGLTVPAVIEHLKSIGVTAVELLPCQAFISEQFLIERRLTNYWGYNQVGWFAPAVQYAVDDAVAEFKTMVKALHAAGLEVILDVVFNHTAEGNEHGPLIAWRGIDNQAYYRLIRQDLRYYDNVTGCGNTVNCEHPAVRALIVDCLKYWVEEMHVDGFRFDLATVLGRGANGFDAGAPFFRSVRAVPALAGIKLIAEPWDIGMGGYQLGRFPPGWSEWNDRYRDTVRSFWRGDHGKVGEFAQRIAGSSDLFQHGGRRPTASINFITAHDGFTLHDLVAYNERHNEANGENGADGTSHNLSWNCGAEGATEDPEINRLRRRQMRNFLVTLFLSQGVPMLQVGDELARTQRGNNNAYCQDNEISWLDWRLRTENAPLLAFVQLLAQLRRGHPEFRRDSFLKGTALHPGVKDVTWLHPRGEEMNHTDWLDHDLRALGVWFGRGERPQGRLLLLLNGGGEAHSFVVPPAPPGAPWIRHFDTCEESLALQSMGVLDRYPLGAHSTVLLEC